MKSEKEKMLSGENYDAFDKTLMKERLHANQLTYEFNHTKPTEIQRRNEIIKQLISTKERFLIEPPFRCDYGYNIKVGKDFYANYGCIILDCHSVTIGDYVMFGPNVQVYTATHPIDPIARQSGVEYAKPVIIGDSVWIGGNSVICPGVTIGNNVTIGAGSVVTKDIPDDVVAVGNPCGVIKRI